MTNEITIRQAWALIAIGPALAMATLFLASWLLIAPDSPAAVCMALCLLVAWFFMCGSMLLGIVALNGKRIPWRRSFLLFVDLGLLPLIVPIAFVSAGSIAAVPVGVIARSCLGDFSGFLIAVEFGSFACIALFPYAPLLWPPFHRNRLVKKGAPVAGANRLVLKSLPLAAFYVAATLLVLLTRPNLLVIVVFVASWVAYLIVHRTILLPRVPSFVSAF